MSNQPPSKKCISFGEITLKTLYPFLVSMLYVLRSYTYLKIKETNSTFWKQNPFFFTLILFLGEFLNLFLSLVAHYLIKTKPNDHFRQSQIITPAKQSKFRYVPSTSQKEIVVWKVYLFLYLSSSAYAGTFSVVNFLTSSGIDSTLDLSFEMRIFNFFFIVTLSYFFLKYPVYKQQKFSIGLVVIGVALTVVFKLVFNVADYDLKFLLAMAIYFVNYLVFSGREVFQKWLMEFYNQTPIKIVLFDSLFGIINMVIMLTAFEGYCYYDARSYMHDSLSALFSATFSYDVIGLFIAYWLCSFSYAFVAIYTKYFFSPTVMPVAYSLSIMLWRIVLITEGIDASQWWFVIYLPGYLLLFLGCLIYNEILIIYICDLSEYTKKEIGTRSKQEVDILNNNMNLILDIENEFV